MLTQQELKHKLHYCPETGIFTHNNPPRTMPYLKGQVAGRPNDQGYVRIGISGKDYKAPRLAFLYMTGDWPQQEVDHINRERDDNRWENLRDVSRMENHQNRGMPVNSLGRGIRKRGETFTAFYRHNKKQVNVGTFNTLEEAVEARRLAVEQIV